MTSIWAKVLAWSLGTLGLSLIVLWGISRLLAGPAAHELDPVVGMVRLIEEDARRTYEEGGPRRLAAYLARVDAFIPGEHHLTDPRGRDLAGGEDRSALLKLEEKGPMPAHLSDGRLLFVGRPAEGRYRFLTLAPPWIEPPAAWPYYAALALVNVLMALALALHLVAPLRRLRRVVDRFGQGELAARSGSTRLDEIGSLARAFDRMAERTETLLGAERRLLQDVSHELRSPLTRMSLAVGLAREEGDRQGALDQVERDIGRLSRVVGELLRLTLAEGDATARRFEPVSLDDLLRTLAEDCALEAQAKGCRLTFPRCDRVASSGDPELIRLAIENVARNAIRHAPDHSEVEVTLVGDPTGARISVRDRGEGVPEEFLDAIFEPFFRVGSDRSRDSGGAGLGLTIARRALSLHGGTVFARNAHPGLEVTIRLPPHGNPPGETRKSV